MHKYMTVCFLLFIGLQFPFVKAFRLFWSQAFLNSFCPSLQLFLTFVQTKYNHKQIQSKFSNSTDIKLRVRLLGLNTRLIIRHWSSADDFTDQPIISQNMLFKLRLETNFNSTHNSSVLSKRMLKGVNQLINTRAK